ncbi:MAG: toll/interleukin-1 receptor domain-containing protein [Burkholderiaceae bacterium]|nr:MAG: toll/interleukin-1 receptor domain-containing protein [Burkholderiaceae bacterium]
MPGARIVAACVAAPADRHNNRTPPGTLAHVKLFISYPSDHKDLAERLRLALEAEDHEVFTDRAELKEGEPYHAALREAIEGADAMLFLITPRSIRPGSYALTELDIAQRRWRSPGRRVLPVMALPTPIEDIPPYLRSVTLLQPKGDVVAETVAAVSRLGPRVSLRLAVWVLVALLVAGAAGFVAYQRAEHARAAEKARMERQAAELAAAVQLCDAGSHAVAWKQFEAIVAAHPDDTAARTAREDCAMRWLREARVASDRETFAALVAPLQPVLAQGMASASGERRADLQAHLGWADFLRSREGLAADPAALYRNALADDAGNIYAHTMWAHWLVWQGGRLEGEVRQHLEAAARGTRERPWLRRMQFSIALLRGELNGYALEVLNQMRAAGEQPDTTQRDLVWRRLIDGGLLGGEAEREQLLSFMNPADALATVEWLYPKEQLVPERQPLLRYVLALLRARAGQQAQARAELEMLSQEQVAARLDTRLSRATAQLLGQLRAPPAR